MAAARRESGSCCDRTPKPASPADRAPTSNSDPQDRVGCGFAALRYYFPVSRGFLLHHQRGVGGQAERGAIGGQRGSVEGV